jgi:hypothetical protein
MQCDWSNRRVGINGACGYRATVFRKCHEK